MSGDSGTSSLLLNNARKYMIGIRQGPDLAVIAQLLPLISDMQNALHFLTVESPGHSSTLHIRKEKSAFDVGRVVAELRRSREGRPTEWLDLMFVKQDSLSLVEDVASALAGRRTIHRGGMSVELIPPNTPLAVSPVESVQANGMHATAFDAAVKAFEREYASLRDESSETPQLKLDRLHILINQMAYFTASRVDLSTGLMNDIHTVLRSVKSAMQMKVRSRSLGRLESLAYHGGIAATSDAMASVLQEANVYLADERKLASARMGEMQTRNRFRAATRQEMMYILHHKTVLVHLRRVALEGALLSLVPISSILRNIGWDRRDYESGSASERAERNVARAVKDMLRPKFERYSTKLRDYLRAHSATIIRVGEKGSEGSEGGERVYVKESCEARVAPHCPTGDDSCDAWASEACDGSVPCLQTAFLECDAEGGSGCDAIKNASKDPACMESACKRGVSEYYETLHDAEKKKLPSLDSILKAGCDAQTSHSFLRSVLRGDDMQSTIDELKRTSSHFIGDSGHLPPADSHFCASKLKDTFGVAQVMDLALRPNKASATADQRKACSFDASKLRADHACERCMKMAKADCLDRPPSLSDPVKNARRQKLCAMHWMEKCAKDMECPAPGVYENGPRRCMVDQLQKEDVSAEESVRVCEKEYASAMAMRKDSQFMSQVRKAISNKNVTRGIASAMRVVTSASSSNLVLTSVQASALQAMLADYIAKAFADNSVDSVQQARDLQRSVQRLVRKSSKECVDEAKRIAFTGGDSEGKMALECLDSPIGEDIEAALYSAIADTRAPGHDRVARMESILSDGDDDLAILEMTAKSAFRNASTSTRTMMYASQYLQAALFSAGGLHTEYWTRRNIVAVYASIRSAVGALKGEKAIRDAMALSQSVLVKPVLVRTPRDVMQLLDTFVLEKLMQGNAPGLSAMHVCDSLEDMYVPDDDEGMDGADGDSRKSDYSSIYGGSGYTSHSLKKLDVSSLESKRKSCSGSPFVQLVANVGSLYDESFAKRVADDKMAGSGDLERFYSNVSSELLSAAKQVRNTIGASTSQAESIADKMTAQFVYDFAADVLVRGDTDLFASSHVHASIMSTGMSLPLPTWKLLGCMRVSMLCLPASKTSHSLQLMESYLAKAVHPMMQVIADGAASLLKQMPDQTKTMIEGARTVADIVDAMFNVDSASTVRDVAKRVQNAFEAKTVAPIEEQFRQLRLMYRPQQSTPTNRIVFGGAAAYAFAHAKPLLKLLDIRASGLEKLWSLLSVGVHAGTAAMGAKTLTSSSLPEIISAILSQPDSDDLSEGDATRVTNLLTFYKVHKALMEAFVKGNPSLYDEYRPFIELAASSTTALLQQGMKPNPEQLLHSLLDILLKDNAILNGTVLEKIEVFKSEDPEEAGKDG